MSEKQRDRVVGILEALKSKGLIVSYRIDSDEIESIVIGWAEGGVGRVCEEVLHHLEPFGLGRTDLGWLCLLLPKDQREELTKALLIEANETANVLLQEIMRELHVES